MLVSSHLINEMSLTAERLVVIGRGGLIAETSVEEFIARNAARGGADRDPDPAAFRRRAARGSAPARPCDGGAIVVTGMPSAADR